MIKQGGLALAALVVALGMGEASSAGQISNVMVAGYNQTQLPTGGWQTVTVTDKTANGLLKQAYGASSQTLWYTGQITLQTDMGTLGVWCVDFLHDIYVGSQDQYTLAPLTNNNADGADGIASTPLSAAQVAKIAQLAALGNAVLEPYSKDTVDATLQSLYKADISELPGGDLKFFDGDLTAFSAAIQASIWDVEYNFSSSGSADFTADLSLIQTDAKDFGNVGGQDMLVTSGGSQQQRQWVSEVPEPGPVALMLSGLLGVAVLRRQRAQRVASRAVSIFGEGKGGVAESS